MEGQTIPEKRVSHILGALNGLDSAMGEVQAAIEGVRQATKPAMSQATPQPEMEKDVEVAPCEIEERIRLLVKMAFDHKNQLLHIRDRLRT